MHDPEQPSILLVDDALDEGATTAEFMSRAGWRSTCAKSGEECLEVLNSGQQWDIVLLDAQLAPGRLSGRQTLKEVLALLPEQCVVFLTGKEIYADQAVAALQAGAIDYIQKPPTDTLKFIKRLQRAIRVNRERIELQRDRDRKERYRTVVTLARAVCHQVIPRIHAAQFRAETLKAATKGAERKHQLSRMQENLAHAEKYLRRLTEFDPDVIRESEEITELRARAKEGVRSIRGLFDLKVDKAGVAFCEPEEGPEALVRFDSRWVGLITEILVHNAAEAVLASENPQKDVTVSVQEDPNGWLLVVDDTGDGIPPELREKLGQPGISMKRGSGLGLYFVTEIVRRENINVDDLLPGTRVTVRFPRA